jgi:hypothetical protein
MKIWLVDDAQRCRDSDMDNYMSKHLRLEERCAMLDKWLPAPFTTAGPYRKET